jgi:hypothetical protein
MVVEEYGIGIGIGQEVANVVRWIRRGLNAIVTR